MRVTIVFDVEDYVTPPEEGLDDLLKMLADVMTEERVSGSFFVIGEKLRSLRDRGRRDVIEALARHDCGSHVNMGSIHPTVTERAEGSGWADGLARMAADEIAGVDELSAILGRPMRSLARHGGSFCPQLLAALGARSLPHVYSPALLPGHQITWYCNTLNFAEALVVFQEAYLSREGFLQAERQFLSHVDEHPNDDWTGIFHSHPCRIKTLWFWDRNYFKGVNTPPEAWAVPDIRPDFSMEAVRQNWALHCSRLRENPDITLGTIADFAAEFAAQAASAEGPEIMALARMAAESDAPCRTDRFSAAEILDLLARAYLDWTASGRLPEALPRRNVLGPCRMPLAVPTARKLAPEAMRRAAQGIATAVDMTGMLPSRIGCGEGSVGSFGEIGPGSAMAALGLALTSGDPSAAAPTRPVAPYPSEGDDIAARVREYRRWACHRLDLDMSEVCRLAALQSWTLKPAWPGCPPDFDPSRA